MPTEHSIAENKRTNRYLISLISPSIKCATILQARRDAAKKLQDTVFPCQDSKFELQILTKYAILGTGHRVTSTQKERKKNLALLLAFSILLWYSSTKEGHRPQSGQPLTIGYNPTCTAKYKVGLFIFACYPYRYRQAMQWEKYQPKTTGSILRMYSYTPPPSFIFPSMGLCRMAQRRIPLSESSGGYHLVTRCPDNKIENASRSAKFFLRSFCVQEKKEVKSVWISRHWLRCSVSRMCTAMGTCMMRWSMRDGSLYPLQMWKMAHCKIPPWEKILTWIIQYIPSRRITFTKSESTDI